MVETGADRKCVRKKSNVMAMVYFRWKTDERWWRRLGGKTEFRVGDSGRIDGGSDEKIIKAGMTRSDVGNVSWDAVLGIKWTVSSHSQ